MSYHLNNEQLKFIFPFHIIFDMEFTVLQVGKTLPKLCLTLQEGMKLQDVFQITRPRTIQNKIENIHKSIENIFFLKIMSTNVELKGQMVFLEGQSAFLYIALPVIKDHTMLDEMGLDLNDFSLFDTTGDFLFLLQANKTNLDDLQKFSQQLNIQNNKLQTLTEHLQENIEKIQASEEELRQNSEELKTINDDLELARVKLLQQTQELAAKNEYVLASINYAKRIQEAILIPLSEFYKALPNSFVFFIPKDILSGDFYWLAQKKNKMVVAAVDCTGHGVPGAFVSLIAENLLDKIVNEQNITEPDLVLENLHYGICRILHQEHNNNNDSLDIAMCVIDKKNKLLEYSGARNPLYLIQNNEMTIIKADKYSVGGLSKFIIERTFTKHVISLHTATTFFITSDGYEDQFGGDGYRKRKFLTKHLRQMLSEIANFTPKQQLDTLENTFFKWKGSESQTDDVLVIGVKLDAMN